MLRHVQGSATSEQAAKAKAADAAEQRSLVYSFILACGPEGCTDAEGQAATGLDGNSWRPRRCELVDAMRIKKTERTRPTPTGRAAAVYVAQKIIHKAPARLDVGGQPGGLFGDEAPAKGRGIDAIKGRARA